MIKSIGTTIQFYSLVGLLNCAVGVMFYVINIAPTPVLASPPPRTSPMVTRAIPATQGIPIRIVVPSVSIDLPVDIGTYSPEDGSWTIDTTRAYYADVSMPANNSNGTTMIYGHAQSTIFKTLPQIQPDAEAIVYTDNNYIFHYQYTTLREAVPTDTSVFTASGAPKLVLQTCIGLYGEIRGLYSFRLVAIEKI